jgi:hypothetical protein
VAALALLGAAPASHAVVPIGGGHYDFETPQSFDTLFSKEWRNQQVFGKGWSMHLWPDARQFTTYAFIDAELDCGHKNTENWRFNLDGMPLDTARGRVKLPPVAISPSGAFSANRPGMLWSGSGDGPEGREEATAWLTIIGQFVSRTRVRGRMLANSTDGCTTGWLPIKGWYLRTGWEELLDRT